jgi:pseudouridine-5'-monophosphatase
MKPNLKILLKKNVNAKLGTEHIYENIVGSIIRSFGKKYPYETRMKILGTTERRTCEIAVKDLALPCSVDDFHKKYRQMCLTDLKDVYLLKGTFSHFKYFSIFLNL